MASATATRYGLSRGLLGLKYDQINYSDSDSAGFSDTHRAIKTNVAKIYVDDNAVSKYFKARSLPYFMGDMVGKELDRLLAEDILDPVHYSDWAAPVVSVMKADKTVRLCGDYKLTMNQVGKLVRYPLPRIEDVYAQPGNGTTYTKLDMRHAYEQIERHPESRTYVSQLTHLGGISHTNHCHTESRRPLAFSRE